MIKRRNIVATFVAALAVAGVVQADLMPVSSLQTDGVAIPSDLREVPAASSATAVPDLEGIGTVASPDEEEVASEGPIVQPLVDRSNSLDLCLYALIGLGVCRSGQLVRRPSLGFIPEWYHTGAPLQIGHSHVVGPDAHCLAAICFVQPDSGEIPVIPQHRHGTIIPHWRCSQYTPSVLASRAPPRRS